jgi:hypothetical protein
MDTIIGPIPNGPSEVIPDSFNRSDIVLSMYQVYVLRVYYEQENEKSFNEPNEIIIPLRISKLTEDYVDLDWSKYVRQDNSINEFKVQWHCLNTNEHFEHRCGPQITSYRIKRLKSGYTYCIKITSIKSTNTMVNRSKNILITITAPPDAPVLKLRACNFKYISFEWNKPLCYGDANLIAYKVYIDGKVEAVLGADQQVFTLSKGEPCHEYTFQVQAMTLDENLSSTLSAPLKVTWPGMKLPHLKILSQDHGILRLGWDEPILSGGSKISFFRVIAESEVSGQAIVVGPLENNYRECEIISLGEGRYKIYLEVNFFGLSDPFCSAPIYVDFGHTPEAPQLSVHVFGLEERKKLDRVAASLANKRDRLLQIVTSTQVKDTVSLSKAMSTLRQLDETLNDCLKMIAKYTGYFIVNLSWTCYQPNPLIKILGFRVFINDEQYGVDLHESIRTIRVKVS